MLACTAHFGRINWLVVDGRLSDCGSGGARAALSDASLSSHPGPTAATPPTMSRLFYASSTASHLPWHPLGDVPRTTLWPTALLASSLVHMRNSGHDAPPQCRADSRLACAPPGVTTALGRLSTVWVSATDTLSNRNGTRRVGPKLRPNVASPTGGFGLGQDCWARAVSLAVSRGVTPAAESASPAPHRLPAVSKTCAT